MCNLGLGLPVRHITAHDNGRTTAVNLRLNLLGQGQDLAGMRISFLDTGFWNTMVEHIEKSDVPASAFERCHHVVECGARPKSKRSKIDDRYLTGRHVPRTRGVPAGLWLFCHKLTSPQCVG